MTYMNIPTVTLTDVALLVGAVVLVAFAIGMQRLMDRFARSVPSWLAGVLFIVFAIALGTIAGLL